MSNEKEFMDHLDANQPVSLTLEDFLILSNGTDEEGDPLSAGSIHIGKISDGQNEPIGNYEIPGGIYEILIRDRFVQVNIDFTRDSRRGLSLAKIAMKKYDEVMNTQEDFEKAVYVLNMVIFPLSLYGRLSLVLVNPIMWVNGENPDDKTMQRLVLVFEKANCQFVSNEEIDIISIRADIEREIKQQYEQEEEAVLRMQEARKEAYEEAEKSAANEMIMNLSGLKENDFNERVEHEYQGRIRFSGDEKKGIEDDKEGKDEDVR